eukprot:TRINITY_DN2252_c0_g3_i3.p1 TRINITY_DN2252_c0_g3~~TRINITY_DN2252_c0_g3_i3.p1  ORF type:complete len:336 (-),score=36.22 TRINITY_DN2252_c0_g3_i3:182-1147(-)
MATSHNKEELSDEHKQLFSSLPKEKGWFNLPLYQYQGFWYHPMILAAAIACQQHFKARDDDLLLVTQPKSGTTWLKALAFAVVYRAPYPSINEHPLLSQGSHDLVPFLEFDLYLNNPNPDLTKMVPPRIFATHISNSSLPNSIKDSGCRIVYLCRNPRDSFISLWHFMNKGRERYLGILPLPLEEAFEMFCRGACEAGPFWDHMLGYWKESLERPERVLFLKYEELKRDPLLHLKRLAEFLGYPFSSKEESEGVVDEINRLCSFENLSNLAEATKRGIDHTIYFRRGEVGDWINYLTPEMIERLDQIIEKKFHNSGLAFQV